MANWLEGGRTLVTGATGKTGRRIVARLEALEQEVRAGSRRAVPSFDWTDAATWAGALEGTRAVYVAFQPDLAVPGAIEIVTRFFAQARAAGVEHIVLLSGRGEVEAEQAEAALRASGVAWTILRASWFMQNFSEGAFLDSIHAGVLALPVTDVTEPFVDADDIADVAVAALTEAGHAGKLYELTGPRALTFAQAAQAIGAATGREIAVQPVSIEAYRAMLEGFGVPDEAVALICYLFGTVLDGRNSAMCSGVAEALGRPAGDFADYARRATAARAWDAR